MRERFRWAICCVPLYLLGCGDDAKPAITAGRGDAGAVEDAGDPPFSSSVYSKDENWLCRPGAATSRCKDPAAATEIGPDNALTTVAAPAKVASKTDCFYVYPTIDVTQVAGRVTDYANIEDIWTGAKQQAEIFGNLCSVYAPLYHQVKIGSYSDPNRDALLEEAYLDVEDAFRHYMAQHNQGRDVILIGHSQGSHMLRRLLQRHFDGADHAAWREQLSVAILLGPLGDITVPKGQLVGGTFKDIPVCTTDSQRGCVITYSSYTQDKPPTAAFGLFVGGIPAGQDTPCTNPAALGGGKAASRGAYFLSLPTGVGIGTTLDAKTELNVKTDMVVYRNLYNLECKQSDSGYSYLAATVQQQVGEKRKDPIVYAAPALAIDLVGLHILDFNLATEDLASIVKKHVQ